MHYNAANIAGMRFGRLTALEPTEKRRDGKIVWRCRCDCGGEAEASTAALSQGKKASCGCLYSIKRRRYAPGMRFGRLVILEYAGKSYWRVRCDCGTEKSVMASNFKKTKSCGCYRDEIRVTHGMSNHTLYKRWSAMMERCRNPEHQHFKHYGGRGIRVCERWQKFENFVEDMGEPPKGYTLDRINVDEGYRPDNCRWVDGSTQAKNKRSRTAVALAGLSDEDLERELFRRRSVFG